MAIKAGSGNKGLGGEGLLNPYVSHSFKAEDFREAAQAKLNGEVVGRRVINF